MPATPRRNRSRPNRTIPPYWESWILESDREPANLTVFPYTTEVVDPAPIRLLSILSADYAFVKKGACPAREYA
jgi:hypothetical protein